MPLKLKLLLKAMRYGYSDLVSFMKDGYRFKRKGDEIEITKIYQKLTKKHLQILSKSL